jgi:putative two-component system response regulator
MNTTEKETVLVVDDNPDNINVLCGILGNEFKLKIASNGSLALKIAAEQPPDLILLDINMPVMNGYEVCLRLRAEQATEHIPIIFVTALGDAFDEAHGFDMGAADYIIKPVNPTVVRARVRAHLALSDQRRDLARLVAERTIDLENSNYELATSKYHLEVSNQQLEASNSELKQSYIEMLSQLARAGEYRDNQTGKHVMRVGNFSKMLGLAAGIAEEQAEMLLYASMMHDVGKIGIPDQILLKPAKLTEVEFELMKHHSEIGAKIIGEHKSELMQMAKQIALTHHERWNGLGYPNGLVGEGIPLVGRIVALVDVFDALISVRPYKEAWPIESAFDWLKKEAGQHFDPELVRLFLSLEAEVWRIVYLYSEDEMHHEAHGD